MASNPNIFNIDFDREAELITAPVKRQSIFLSWVRVMVSHLKTLNNEILVVFRQRKFDEAKYTAQHITFEGALNQHFGVVGAPFIFIKDNITEVDFFFIAADGDADQSFIGISPDDGDFIGIEAVLNQIHYTINVPVGAGLLEEEVRTFANTLNTCARIFNIVFF